MKNLFRFLVGMVVVAVFIAFMPSIIFAEQVKKGDSTILVREDVIRVKNLKPIKNINKTFSYDDECHIQDGGKVIAIGVMSRNGGYTDLLVRYQITGKQKGRNCPSGTIFLISEISFSHMKAENDQYLADKAREKNLIKKILSNK